MAITYGFFNSLNGDRTYNADQMSEYFKGLVSDGVYENVGNALQVLASSGMTVQVGTGRAIINSKWIDNDAALTLTINPAHATLKRYTAVVVQLDMVNRLIDIVTIDGTPASSPAYPTLTNNEYIMQLCLAYVYVGAGVVAITQANITDMRASSSCGWITGLIEQVDTSQLFLQWQTAYQNYYDSMTQQFNEWFSTLTDELNVNTYIEEYTKSVTLAISDSRIVALDMTNYTYENSDIFFVYFNGLYAVKNVDWYLDTSGSTPQMHLNLTNSTTSEYVIIKILKSKIGFNQG